MSEKSMRKVPIIATVVVIGAVLTMIGLGVWQLGRLDEKEAMIARYESAQANQSVQQWFATDDNRLYDVVPIPYSRVETTCFDVQSISARAGRNAQDQAGWIHYAECTAGQGMPVEIGLGWSNRPDGVEWDGGPVIGTILYEDDWRDWRVIADPPLAGLQANATPDPNDLPNNHLAYAGQWFFFALSALVIYALALRRRWRDGNAEG